MSIIEQCTGASFPEHAACIRRSVRRFARSLGFRLDTDEVEDLVQETFLALLERGKGKRTDHIRGYIAQTARNVTLDVLRSRSAAKRDHRKTTTLPEEVVLPSPAVTPEEAVLQRSELVRCLALARSVLPRRSFLILWLSCGKGFTSVEIGRMLGMSSRSVDTVRWRARIKLRETLSGEDAPCGVGL